METRESKDELLKREIVISGPLLRLLLSPTSKHPWLFYSPGDISYLTTTLDLLLDHEKVLDGFKNQGF